MKDMKLTAAEAKAYDGECCGPSGADAGPRYPWGLELYLHDEVLKKLGMATLPAVGTELVLQAKVHVTGVSMRERQGGEKSQTLDIQITSMELAAPAGDVLGRAAKKLYGDMA
jgi:hypothetical protein